MLCVRVSNPPMSSRLRIIDNHYLIMDLLKHIGTMQRRFEERSCIGMLSRDFGERYMTGIDGTQHKLSLTL